MGNSVKLDMLNEVNLNYSVEHISIIKNRICAIRYAEAVSSYELYIEMQSPRDILIAADHQINGLYVNTHKSTMGSLIESGETGITNIIMLKLNISGKRTRNRYMANWASENMLKKIVDVLPEYPDIFNYEIFFNYDIVMGDDIISTIKTNAPLHVLDDISRKTNGVLISHVSHKLGYDGAIYITHFLSHLRGFYLAFVEENYCGYRE